MMKKYVASQILMAILTGTSGISLANVPASNTVGTVVNSTAPYNAIIFGQGATLDYSNPGNNMNKSIILGVDASVSSQNIDSAIYKEGPVITYDVVNYHRQYSYQPHMPYLPSITDRTDAASVIAIGTMAGVYANNDSFLGGISIGDQAASYGSGTALGGGSFAATHATSLGYESMAEGDNSVALGYSAYANQIDGIAMGTSAYSLGSSSIAMGVQSQAEGDNSIAIGMVSRTSADGATAVGTRVNVQGSQSGAFGYYDSYLKPAVTGANSYTVGSNSFITGDLSSNLGTNSTISGSYSGNLGTNSTVAGTASYSVGYNNTLTNDFNGNFGSYNNVSGYGSYSTGMSNTISGGYSAVVGDFNTVSTEDTFVLGENVSKTADNSVFLGRDTAYVEEGATTKGLSTSYTSYTINGLTYNYAGGDINGGVVSVGSTTQTRRIQNVAPGYISATSTDAINGSQLYATNNILGNLANTTASGIGGGSTVDPDGTMHVSLAVNGNTYNNVQDALNAIPINNGGSTTAINPNGIYYDNADKKQVTLAGPNGTTITNVAPGMIAPNSTDAVNGGQLYNVANRIDKIGNRLDKVGAGAAALAALHPLDFDPDDKWNFAAGYGNYAGANAMSLGAFYRPNEDTMFSLAGSMGNGENMVNAGISIKLGQKNGVSTSRVAMAKEIVDLKNKNMELQSRLDNMEQKLNAVLSGQTGSIATPVNNSLTDSSDNRIRVDRISGKDNDTYKVERVRINNKDTKDGDDHRDIYGSHIAK